MKKIILFVILLSILTLPIISSQEITYPIAELENCESQSECQIYCDDVQNIESCINSAEKYGLMTSEEIAEAKKIIPFLKAGTTPGQCKSELECNAYCDKEENLIECVDFALKIGDINEKEAQMIKKSGGKGPGGCKKDECKTYCDDETHINECVDFAVQNGMMDAEEAEMVKKTGGKGPGGCKGKEECDNYCKDEANIETCIDFSVQNGFMNAEEAEMVKKTKGKSPGDCKSKEECDKFCESEEGRDICLEFSRQYGIISEEEYQKGKMGPEEMGQAGPGGCKSEEECQAFCEKEENREECNTFEGSGIPEGEYDQQTPGTEQGTAPEGAGSQSGDESLGVNHEDGTAGDSGITENLGPGPSIPGGGSGGSEPGDAPASTPGSAEPSSSDAGSGGESAPVTGEVIIEQERFNLFEKIMKFFNNQNRL